MNTVEVLQQARDIVAEGWCKDALEKDGNHCALGALNMAAFGNVNGDFRQELPGWRELNSKVRELGYPIITVFNNAPETTKQDVLDLFSKTLADLGGL